MLCFEKNGYVLFFHNTRLFLLHYKKQNTPEPVRMTICLCLSARTTRELLKRKCYYMIIRDTEYL